MANNRKRFLLRKKRTTPRHSCGDVMAGRLQPLSTTEENDDNSRTEEWGMGRTECPMIPSCQLKVAYLGNVSCKSSIVLAKPCSMSHGLHPPVTLHILEGCLPEPALGFTGTIYSSGLGR